MDNIQLGLKENWKQFTLLVIVNAFVGGMVGLERSILPEIAEKEFALVVKTAILSFIIVFGITKALTNYFAGTLANKYGRKKLLILGWDTAMVYSTFLASIAENTNPIDRAKSIGIFRLWRDLGYTIGAILTGLIADAYNINSSIVFIGVLTLISAIIIKVRMQTKINCISKQDAQKRKIILPLT